MSTPKVTVLMPVYNAEKYVGQAVESILNQTFHNFELVIIDDGSTDYSARAIASYQDHRIRYFRNNVNSGIVCSLNRGIEISKGSYIARMDADDISLPNRLSRQVQFLDTHPAISVIGTNMLFVDSRGAAFRKPLWNIPENSLLIHWWLMLGLCGVNHPTVMARVEVLRRFQGYDPNFVHCEDYELWLRCCRTTSIANLLEPSLLYRLHSGNVTAVHNRTQRQNVVRALHAAICNLLERSVPVETVHDFMLSEPLNVDRATAAANLLEEMLEVFVAINRPSREEQKMIRLIATDRLIGMAHDACRRDPLASIRLLQRAYRMSGRHIMPVIARKIVNRITSEYS